MPVLWVFLGGGMGSVARYCLIQMMSQTSSLNNWPVGVFVVNIIGCFALGLCAPIVLKFAGGDVWAKFLLVGFLGGFTTFSTFAYDTVELLGVGQTHVAMAYALGSVFLGMVAVFVGVLMSRMVLG